MLNPISNASITAVQPSSYLANDSQVNNQYKKTTSSSTEPYLTISQSSTTAKGSDTLQPQFKDYSLTTGSTLEFDEHLHVDDSDREGKITYMTSENDLYTLDMDIDGLIRVLNNTTKEIYYPLGEPPIDAPARVGSPAATTLQVDSQFNITIKDSYDNTVFNSKDITNNTFEGDNPFGEFMLGDDGSLNVINALTGELVTKIDKEGNLIEHNNPTSVQEYFNEGKSLGNEVFASNFEMLGGSGDHLLSAGKTYALSLSGNGQLFMSHIPSGQVAVIADVNTDSATLRYDKDKNLIIQKQGKVLWSTRDIIGEGAINNPFITSFLNVVDDGSLIYNGIYLAKMIIDPPPTPRSLGSVALTGLEPGESLTAGDDRYLVSDNGRYHMAFSDKYDDRYTLVVLDTVENTVKPMWVSSDGGTDSDMTLTFDENARLIFDQNGTTQIFAYQNKVDHPFYSFRVSDDGLAEAHDGLFNETLWQKADMFSNTEFLNSPRSINDYFKDEGNLGSSLDANEAIYGGDGNYLSDGRNYIALTASGILFTFDITTHQVNILAETGSDNAKMVKVGDFYQIQDTDGNLLLQLGKRPDAVGF
ncbi:MAG: hypothetical protein AAFZ92_01380 [Pseudomonadota bacterium]